MATGLRQRALKEIDSCRVFFLFVFLEKLRADPHRKSCEKTKQKKIMSDSLFLCFFEVIE
jgi:hypothetical protein